MTTLADFLRWAEDQDQVPEGRDLLDQLTRAVEAIAGAEALGNDADADRLLADLRARVLLATVFLDWDLGTLGAGVE